MRVLIVGGAGFLGSYLAPALDALGHDVALCDDFSGSIRYRSTDRFRVFTTNCTDLNAIQHPFNAFNPEILIIAVAHHFSRDVIYKFYEDTKLVLGTANPICSVLSPALKHVYYCSGHEVYGGPQTNKPLRENRKITRSATQHGAAERAAEILLGHQCQEVGVPFTVLRLFDLYGPRIVFSARTGVISFLIDTVIRDEAIGLVEAKKNRDFIHVEDARDAILAVIGAGVTGTINIGTGIPTSLRQLMQEISTNIEVRHPVYEVPRQGVYSSIACTKTLDAIVPGGWHPKHNVTEDMADLVKFRVDENTTAERTDPVLVLNEMRGVR